MKSLLFSFLLIALLIPMESTLQAQDWANLNRFEAANAEIGPVKEGERRVVFIGDSITEGWS